MAASIFAAFITGPAARAGQLDLAQSYPATGPYYFEWKEKTFFGLHVFSGYATACGERFWGSGKMHLSGNYPDGTTFDLEGTFELVRLSPPKPPSFLPSAEVQVGLSGNGRSGEHSGELVDVINLYIEIDEENGKAYVSAQSTGVGKQTWFHPEAGAMQVARFLGVHPPADINVGLKSTQPGEQDCRGRAEKKWRECVKIAELDATTGSSIDEAGCDPENLFRCLVRGELPILDEDPVIYPLTPSGWDPGCIQNYCRNTTRLSDEERDEVVDELLERIKDCAQQYIADLEECHKKYCD